MRRHFLRDFLAVFVPTAAICVGAIWFTLRYVQPAPPTTFVMSTSSKTSPYYMLATRFKEEVAKKGITIEVREFEGVLRKPQAPPGSFLRRESGFRPGRT